MCLTTSLGLNVQHRGVCVTVQQLYSLFTIICVHCIHDGVCQHVLKQTRVSSVLAILYVVAKNGFQCL